MEDGRGVGAQVPAAFCWTPHDVDAHCVPENSFPSNSTSRHQPRSWLKAEAPLNMFSMPHFPTLSIAQPLMSWLKAEASMNIFSIVVTPEVSHAPMSSLKNAAAEL